MEEQLIGKITHYYSKVSVGIVELTDGGLKVGDAIRIKGGTTDFEQTVDSIQYEHQDINEAKEGQSVGVKVAQKVRDGDLVYKK